MAAADPGGDDHRRVCANRRGSPDPCDVGEWWGDLPPLGALPAPGTPPPLGTAPTSSRPPSPLPAHFPLVDAMAGGDSALPMVVNPTPPLSLPLPDLAGRRLLLAPGAPAGREAGSPAPPLRHEGTASVAGDAISDGSGDPLPAQ